MIPKTVHFCWFGKGEKPELVRTCIASWREYLLGYDIIEWNEDNFDISANKYCRQAYESHKWAFVSDYVRLHVLYYHGGVYMDSDVQVLKPLDTFLEHGAFSGFEQPSYMPTGIIGAERGNLWIKDHLDHYESRAFILSDGTMDITTNVSTMTAISKKMHGFIPDGNYQVLAHDVHIYPREWFCPSRIGGNWQITGNTHTIHHFMGSWITRRMKIKTQIAALIANTLGQDALDTLTRIKQSLGR